MILAGNVALESMGFKTFGFGAPSQGREYRGTERGRFRVVTGWRVEALLKIGKIGAQRREGIGLGGKRGAENAHEASP